MSIFNILYQQSCLEIFAKGHRQLVAEQRDRASRVSSKLSVPGYARVLVQNPDGSDSIQRIYTAPYLQYQQSDRAWKLYKALYPLLLIAGVILLILSMLSPSVLNSVPLLSPAVSHLHDVLSDLRAPPHGDPFVQNGLQAYADRRIHIWPSFDRTPCRDGCVCDHKRGFPLARRRILHDRAAAERRSGLPAVWSGNKAALHRRSQ